jgi:deoxyribose-phosphate aldolase
MQTLGSDSSIARRSIPLLDLTDLADDTTDAAVDRLCARAVGRHGTVAAVCIWPRFVDRAAVALRGSGVRVATVVDFPSGAESIDEVVAATRRAIEAGADEIDTVLPYQSLLAGREAEVAEVLHAVRAAVPRDRGRLLKVILETGELPDAETIERAALLALDHGADFLKTSTGKTAVSATLAATEVMLAVIRHRGSDAGLKPSGGIRTVDEAGRYLSQADDMMGRAWVTPRTFRFGASSLLDELERVLDDEVAGERGGA